MKKRNVYFGRYINTARIIIHCCRDCKSTFSVYSIRTNTKYAWSIVNIRSDIRCDPLNYKDRSKNMLGSGRCNTLSFIVYICLIVTYSSRRFGGKLAPKGRLGRGGVYAMYSMKVTLWLRREQGYLSALASIDRKAGRLSLPFYSIEFFGIHHK